jgi:tetratricopeptide (TPR) repeat protein
VGEEQVKHALTTGFFGPKRAAAHILSLCMLGGCAFSQSPTSSSVSIKKMPVRRPVSAAKLFEAGMGLSKQGDHEKAVSAFEKATKADPKLGVAYLEWASSLLYVQDDHERIAKLLKQAVTLLPGNPRAHAHYGQALARTNREREALVHWKKALELRPSLVQPRLDMADILERKGHSAQALAQLEHVVRMKPKHVQARVRLGQLLATQNKFLQAAHHLEKAAVQTLRSAALYRRAAQFYASAGQMEDARRMRAQADKIDPPRRGRNLRPLRKARRFKGS